MAIRSRDLEQKLGSRGHMQLGTFCAIRFSGHYRDEPLPPPLWSDALPEGGGQTTYESWFNPLPSENISKIT